MRTKFDYPGAAGTWGLTVNDAGVITGWYVDAAGVAHGFLRAPDGKFTTFDAPGAGNESGQGTIGYWINKSGAITGFYVDANYVCHGFLRLAMP